MRLFRKLSSPSDQVLLSGNRVYLRAPIEKDWRYYQQIRSLSRDFLEPWEPTWPIDALARDLYLRNLNRYAAEWKDNLGHSFFIFRNKDDFLLGGISLTNVRWGVSQCGTLGYWIGKPYARKGYMTEALRLITSFCFDDLRLHRIEAACLPHNEASQRLLRGANFTEHGYARKYLKIRGQWHDHLLFSLLNEEHKKN
jgi:ribosomal-protein-alanine N-acetyltransferase